jgi:class 3 adenylate cyclase
MDIGRWLRSLGLGQYEAAFRDNEIDGDVLPKLTVEDLKDLGVAVVGHRRKIISAIEALNAATAAPAQAPLSSIPASGGAPPDAAERRQLTVMFSDLIGSTALSARLDPEDMRQVIRAYQDACSGVVARYDGFIAKFMGDGVLAYFGFPRAHEDDAARAVHAGLEIAEAVKGLAEPVEVFAASGVVVSAATRRLIGDRFRLRDLGKHARLDRLAAVKEIVPARHPARLRPGPSYEL